jgi:POT family proton-dependent oligopeptide transporter
MSATEEPAIEGPTLFGHPTGLFALFFAEMWERFSYYGMRALLVFYMMKGFLAYNDGEAYKIYGAYTALVYMTPFFGGLIADRVLGAKRAVIVGGVLMALGHLLMGIEAEMPFFVALALLIVGNGFFKPNISTIVGSLYPDGSSQRDSGFTIFYMGINLGAAAAPLLCGYIGETYGWHYGFNLATLGMMIGLAVFVIPAGVARFLVLGGALASGAALFMLSDELLLLLVNGFVGIAIIAAAAIAFAAMGKGGLPEGAGDPPEGLTMQHQVMVAVGTVVAIPVFAGLVWSNRLVSIIPASVIEQVSHAGGAFGPIAAEFLASVSTPTGLILTLTGVAALVYIAINAVQGTKVERERLGVVVILMFFSMLFWAFFEQAGTSVNNFTDRNVDRVFEERVITSADVGKSVDLVLTQEQLGYTFNGRPFTMDQLDEARDGGKLDLALVVDESHVGMGIGGSPIPASTFQSANPIYIVMFGLVFSVLWRELGKRGLEPSTPIKFALGLGQLGLGFVVLWYGATTADPRGMVGVGWLLLGYLLHTTGELCLSPVGLSMVTKLSPQRLVSTVMGAWFLATAFSNLVAAVIAGFTGVSHGGGEEAGIPVPAETVHVYGSVFGQIGAAALGSAVVLVVMTPLLKKWMHPDAPMNASADAH